MATRSAALFITHTAPLPLPKQESLTCHQAPRHTPAATSAARAANLSVPLRVRHKQACWCKHHSLVTDAQKDCKTQNSARFQLKLFDSLANITEPFVHLK